MKNKVSKLNKHIYPKGQNPFAGAKIVRLKKTFTYPDSGSVRFQIQLDSNGQVYEIRRSFAQVIKDEETKKRFVKITLGGRPRNLYDRVKGRPMFYASPWIDMFIEEELAATRPEASEPEQVETAE